MKKNGATVRILKLFKSQKKMVAFLLVLITIAVGLDVSVPLISQKLIDRLIAFFKENSAPPFMFLIVSAAGILAATVFSRALHSFYNYHLFKMVTSTEDNARRSAFENYLRLHALFHHRSSSRQIIGRIERGGVAIYAIAHDIFGQNLIPPLIVFVSAVVILFVKNPFIALAVFAPLPIYIFAVRKLTEKIYQIEKVVNEQFEDVSKEAYDVAGNVLTVKKFAQESAEAAKQKRLMEKARATQYGAERLWSIIENIQTLLAAIGRIGVILLGGFFVLNGQSTIGEFVLFISLQNMAYSPLAQLSVVFPRLRRNGARAERLFDIIDEPARVVDKSDAEILPPLEKAIVFRDVSFYYGEGRQMAVRDLNVEIPARRTVALVGRSGSGKTTFINLLLRSYDPTKGEILIDGHNLKDIKRKSLLEQIAVVPQELDLFSRSIADNIAYGKVEINRDDVIQAARTALAHDFIMKTENGYDTVVGERGMKLSGGERQRVGIARAVLRDPKILILDEATSHLDTESERLISQATDALVKNRTTIIIAHRLSTVLGADTILVFNDGCIEARGKHEELLETSPTYQRLYSLQFQE